MAVRANEDGTCLWRKMFAPGTSGGAEASAQIVREYVCRRFCVRRCRVSVAFRERVGSFLSVLLSSRLLGATAVNKTPCQTAKADAEQK
jgi:hypothetical protein